MDKPKNKHVRVTLTETSSGEDIIKTHKHVKREEIIPSDKDRVVFSQSSTKTSFKGIFGIFNRFFETRSISLEGDEKDIEVKLGDLSINKNLDEISDNNQMKSHKGGLNKGKEENIP